MEHGTYPDEVLVGVDAHDSALRAVRWAAHEAAARDVGLRIVFTSPYPTSPQQPWRLPARRAQAIVSRARQYAHQLEPGLPIGSRVLTGSPSRALLRVSERSALLVVAVTGTDGFAGRHLGSVASAVSTYGHCPVVLVRRGPTAADPVVLGVEDSAASRAAALFAFDYAARHGRRLVAVHVGHDLPATALHRVPSMEPDLPVPEWLAEDAHLYPTVPVRYEVEQRRPADALLRRSLRANLLVIGSRGRGSVTGLLLGATGQQLVRQASCPVAVIHPHDIETEPVEARLSVRQAR